MKPTEQEAAIAERLGLPANPQLWPMDIINDLVRTANIYGPVALYRKIKAYSQPPEFEPVLKPIDFIASHEDGRIKVEAGGATFVIGDEVLNAFLRGRLEIMLRTNLRGDELMAGRNAVSMCVGHGASPQDIADSAYRAILRRMVEMMK